MAITIGAMSMLGLCPNCLWTVLVLSLLWAILPLTFPKNSSVDDVVAPEVCSHPEDINDSPSLSSKWNPPLSAPSSDIRAQATPPDAFTAEPIPDGEESDSEETVVESEDESANPKSLIKRGVRRFSTLVFPNRSRSTTKDGASRRRQGRSLDGRGVRLLPSGDDSTGLSPLQYGISLIGDYADGSEAESFLSSREDKGVELAKHGGSLAQKEVDNSNLQDQVCGMLKDIQEKDAVIVSQGERLEQYRKLLRQRCGTLQNSDSQQHPSELERQTANKPLDARTRKDYEYEIRKLREKFVECNSLLEAFLYGAVSPPNSPTESRDPLAKGNQKLRAHGIRFARSE